MSQKLVDAVWRSPAPQFLKFGVLGALAAWASDDGTFTVAPTVKRLTEHRYLDGTRTLSERSVRYQLRLLERAQLLTAPPHIGGRGHARQYSLHRDKLLTIKAEFFCVIRSLAKGGNVKGATEPVENSKIASVKGAIKGAIKGATEVYKGGNKGGNRSVDHYSEIYCSEVKEVPRHFVPNAPPEGENTTKASPPIKSPELLPDPAWRSHFAAEIRQARLAAAAAKQSRRQCA